MVIGIVAEYNPFHNGHKLQIDYAKNTLHADQVVVAMSGSFTQRGEIACFDKYTRAEAALKCGADVILEIPTIFATSSAREFASAGVQLLASTGIVDTILFSAECSDKNIFISESKKLVELEESGIINNEINALVASGISYATARAKALKTFLAEDIISSPNNILGIEYCRYIYANGLNLNIEVMKRQGNAYNDLSLSGKLSSATSIREHYKFSKDFSAVPDEVVDLYNNACFINANDISSLLHYKLLSCNNFEHYLDCNKDLSDRIKNSLNEFVSFTQFCQVLKCKNFEYSRISRVLCHILLEISDEDFNVAKSNGYITYIRMLGFSKNGNKYLGKIKEKSECTFITSPTDDVDYHDILSSDILRIIQTKNSGSITPNEFTRKFNLTNI